MIIQPEESRILYANDQELLLHIGTTIYMMDLYLRFCDDILYID
jgi:hypothetical protein